MEPMWTELRYPPVEATPVLPAATWERVSETVADCLREATETLTAELVQWAVTVPEVVASEQRLPAAVWLMQWRGLPLELELSAEAVEALLAALLGQPAVGPAAGSGAMEQRLLQLLGTEIGGGLAVALGLPQPETGHLSARPSERPQVLGPHRQAGVRVAYRGVGGAALLRGTEETLAGLGAPPPARMKVKPLTAARLPLEAVLPGPTLTAGEIAGLAEGDVICFDPGELEAVLRVAGVAIGRGRAGAREGWAAIEVTQLSPLEQEGSDGS